MTSIIISILAVTGAAGTLGGIFIAYKYIALSERNEKLESDALVSETLLEAAKNARDGFKAQLDATSAQLRTERDLRAVAESQRNNAYQQVRDHVVQRIQASGIADASRLVGDLLAAPLPGLSPQLPAVPAGTAADGRGPAADVQPAATAAADHDAGGHAAG